MATLSDGNYTGLRASLGDWLHRSDLTNTDLGNFVYLFEAEFNASMRIRGMEAQTTIGITSGYLPHPADWQAWKNIVIPHGSFNYNLSPMAEESKNVVYGGSDLARPQGYVVRGSRTYLVPSPDASYTVNTTYFQGIPSLSSNYTNWLMTKFPQCYLYGSLLQAQAFVSDEQKIARWTAAYSSAMDEALKESRAASYLGATPYVRPDRSY